MKDWTENLIIEFISKIAAGSNELNNQREDTKTFIIPKNEII